MKTECRGSALGSLLFGAAVWLAGTLPAAAFIAYVSNEKSNTVSVIDTDKWAVIKTIKVGQRPRGIEFTKDGKFVLRSEEHTSELQSQSNLVCRLLLEKKKKI